MALTLDPLAWAYLALAAAFLILFIGLLVYLARSARAPTLAAKEPAKFPTLAPGESVTLASLLARENASPEPYLARFVYDAEDEKAGETVGVHGSQLIVKRKTGFAALPTERVVFRDGELRLGDDVDWAAAEEAGEAWRASRHDAIEYDAEGNPVTPQ